MSESFHFNQQSWLMKARQLQRLQADWAALCKTQNMAAQTHWQLALEPPTLTVTCSAAVASKLRQCAPELSAKLFDKGWGELEIVCTIEKRADTLHKAWAAQQAPWRNPNEDKLGLRTPPNIEQKKSLQSFYQSVESLKKHRQRTVAKKTSR